MKSLTDTLNKQADDFRKALDTVSKERGKSKAGITRPDKSETKKARQKSKASRKKNAQISSKKSRPTGSKKRK